MSGSIEALVMQLTLLREEAKMHARAQLVATFFDVAPVSPGVSESYEAYVDRRLGVARDLADSTLRKVR